jgi:hypothetical protein
VYFNCTISYIIKKYLYVFSTRDTMKKNLLSILFLYYAFILSTSTIAQEHLLLTEAVLTPPSGEYIEIYNPTGSTVDLTNYYLSDDEDYALYPGTFGSGPAPTIISSDFIAQFPAGAEINAGQVLIIAFNDTGFFATFGLHADFEIRSTDAGTPDMLQSNVGASASLTNVGENVCLFWWDGLTDLVSDVDMVNLGTPSSINDIGDKSGVAVDGPDADTLKTMYLADGSTMPQQPSDPGFGFSTKRELLEGANEFNSGGNGITGHDETTEDIIATWDTIFVAPDPGVVGPGVPVELASFTASVNENIVTLNWITATELNNSGFDILRSTQQDVWEKISFVAGNGTTTEIHYYSFEDENLNAGKYSYKLKQIDFDGSYEYSNVVYVDVTVPVEFELSQNYPNPFNPTTTIKFAIPEATMVTLNVFNALGEEVALLVDWFMESGIHQVNFDAVGLNSGMYFYRLQAGDFNQVKKMTLLK